MKKSFTMLMALALPLAMLQVAGAQAPPAAPVAAPAPKPVPPPKVGDMLPDFTLKNGVTGKDMTFSKDIKGKAKVTAVIFFSTGCSSCLAEMNEMNVVALEMKPEKFQMIGIAIDKRGEKTVKLFNEDNKFEATYLLDPTFSLPPKFGFKSTPAAVLVTADGKIAELIAGYDPNADKGAVAKSIMELAK